MSAIVKQIKFIEATFDSLSEGVNEKPIWLINLVFGEAHTLLIMDLIKRLADHTIYLCSLFEQMGDW